MVTCYTDFIKNKELTAMEETASRKLHPVLEMLIVTAIALILSLLKGVAFSTIVPLVVSGKISLQLYSTLTIAANLTLNPLFLFAAGLICFKLIEKRPVHWGILLLISFAYFLVTWFPSLAVTNYIAAFGGADMLAVYSKINALGTFVLAGVLFTLIVRLLSVPKSEDAPPVQISLVSHVLLLMFTFGIWNLIWIYRVTRYLNCTPEEPHRHPGIQLLLCIFVPFYHIYWVYQSARRIDKLANGRAIDSDLTIVCLILEIFVYIVPPILMQDKINKILEA
jgi:hypothetical protein